MSTKATFAFSAVLYASALQTASWGAERLACFCPSKVVTVAAYDWSSFIAAASASRVANWPGAPETIAAHFVSISPSMSLLLYVFSCRTTRSSSFFNVSPELVALSIKSFLVASIAPAMTTSENVFS